MKNLNADLASHLATGATTLCNCWRLTRRDQTILGFTDHDRALQFDGTIFVAASGFTASAIETSLGLSVDNLEAVGALSDASLTEADLRAGLYDDADVEVWRVNWQDPAQRVLMRSGSLGEVRRGPLSFTAELRGLAHRLGQPTGHLYQFTCDAALGDLRCTVDLETAAYKAAGLVNGMIDTHTLDVSGLLAFDTDWFASGTIEWTGGANLGLPAEIKSHGKSGQRVTLELWEAPVREVAQGDGFTVRAGCDKHFATCKAKFSNAANFRGFPHMPGTDWVISWPRRDGQNDGGSRYA